jgi:hypothetical protein
MIGVISKNRESRAVEEFFQLFKTPWEYYVPLRRYDIVVATCENVPENLNTRVLAVYCSNQSEAGAEGIAAEPKSQCEWLEWDGIEFPIYGDVAVLKSTGQQIIRLRGTGETVGVESRESGYQTIRLGFDLFQQVSFLLSQGQPCENAHIPTLDIHISLLRSIMVRGGISFVEVRPVPAGYDFAACLTHDVDFTGIREHKLDHTMWGFVYRALFVSLIDALKGTLPWSRCWHNWKAVFSLPFVYFGVIEDFWLEFDRYMEIERGLGSTFFFIPFGNYPGTRDSRPAPSRRAAKYELSKIKEQVRDLVRRGCEVGLHGVDAWQDGAHARLERSKITEITGQSEVGVRMHWLYFGEDSPEALEEAALSYDSTFGYNDAVGFRAGTSQVFAIPPATTLLELPLSIQDTALFYPGRMHLSETMAMDSCRHLIRQAAEFGGVLTVNWHTRSLSPERLWGDFYQRLLGEMQQFRVWFGTAGSVVNWFRTRRALRFQEVQFGADGLRLKMTAPALDGQPPFVVRVCRPRLSSPVGTAALSSTPAYCDIPWKGEAELTLLQEEYSRI